MFEAIKEWNNQLIIDNSRLTVDDWLDMTRRIAILDRLSDEDLIRLSELATLFLHEKSIQGAGGLELTDAMRQTIALQACLPILNLGLEWYKGWTSIIVYPSSYKTDNTRTDEMGIVHESTQHRSGEAWQRGPVVLSWRDVRNAGERDGNNVVIHEFVHKLDMLNGRANGFPPMSDDDMDTSHWTTVMQAGFDDFQQNPKAGINSYGATNPAEFFAVLSEVFFERPIVLKETYPDIFEMMVKFFKQNPL